MTLGLLASVTGALATATGGEITGAEAAIALQNAKGGVDGRKIKLAIGDDQSSPNDALAVTQSLVQQKHAFAVMEESAFFTLAYKYLEQQGIPAITELSFDGGPEWADPTTHDLVEGAGASGLTPPAASWSWLVKVLKAEQCTKLATIAQGAVQTGVRYANGIKAAVQAAGIQVVDEDNSLGLTQTDVTPNALKMKSTGADCWYGIVGASTVEALLTALQQQNVSIKTIAIGYSPGAFVQTKGLVTTFPWATPEINPAAGSQIIAAMQKYEGYKGTTGFEMPNDTYIGWAMGQLAIQGLEGAGKNPTATSFLNSLHNITAFTAGGIQAPVNLAQSKQGTYAPSVAGNCSYALKAEGTDYVPLSTQPYCSTGA